MLPAFVFNRHLCKVGLKNNLQNNKSTPSGAYNNFDLNSTTIVFYNHKASYKKY